MLSGSLAAAASSAEIQYTVTVRPPDGGVHVALRIEGVAGADISVAMPSWIPGYYRRLDLHKFVKDLKVTRDGAPVEVTQPADGVWRFPNQPGRPATVEYDVPEFDGGFSNSGDQTLGQMGVYVDHDSAFVQPGAALVYVEGQKESPATVTLKMPEGWKVATPLRPERDGSYSAPDYDTLNDSPIQMGRFRRVPFRTRGKSFEAIVTGESQVTDAAFKEVLQKVCGAGLDLFEGWAPFDTYQFHLHFPPQRRFGGPGLEHRDASVIVMNGRTDDAAFRSRSWHIILHEFLHAWNVKAIRPEGLGPFDYQANVRTPSLWFSEGVTEYYTNILGARAGFCTPEESLAALSGSYNGYLQSRGRNVTSLSDASLRVWENGSSSGAGGTNYYTKGALAGFLLDARIRAATSGRKSLDDAMRWMVREYAQKNRGFPPDGPLVAIRSATGVDLAADYRLAVETTKDLPFIEALPPVGIAVHSTLVTEPVFGVEFDPEDKDSVVRGVTQGSLAAEVGVLVGDVLVALDGKPVAERPSQGLLRDPSRKPGDDVTLTIRRDGEEKTVKFKVRGRETARLSPDPDASEKTRALWKGFWKPDRFARPDQRPPAP